MNLVRTAYVFFILTSSLYAQQHTYQNYQTLKENLEKIESTHPNLVQLERLGSTAGGRQVLLIKLGNGIWKKF